MSAQNASPHQNPGSGSDFTSEQFGLGAVPGVLKYTMSYTNRPCGIQQVISFDRPLPATRASLSPPVPAPAR